MRTARLRPLTIAAEMQWSLMPPLTVGSERVVVSGIVEPSYEVGGDIFDDALSDDRAQVAIFDAMSHGLEAALLASVAVGAHEAVLEPGDRLMLYSDGVVEGIDGTTGEPFGIKRLVDLVARAEAAGEPVPETMRRLGHAVVKHQGHELQDDATQVLLEWRGAELQKQLR